MRLASERHMGAATQAAEPGRVLAHRAIPPFRGRAFRGGLPLLLPLSAHNTGIAHSHFRFAKV